MTTTRRVFRVFTLAWSPDGVQLAIGGTGTTVRILDAATLATRRVYRGHAAVIRSVMWSPNGRYVASTSEDHTIQVWSSGDGVQAAAWSLQWPHRVAWSHRGDLLAASSHSAVDLWKADDWTHARTIPGGASSLAWSPDGSWLAAGSGARVRLVPIRMAGIERSLACRALKYVQALSSSPNGDRLAVGGNNPEAVEVWEVSEMPGADSPRLTYRGHHSYIWSVDWAPSGRCIASGGRDQVHLWDPASGALCSTYHGHAGDIYGLAWSPDGKRLASGGEDRTVQILSTGDTMLRDGHPYAALHDYA